MILVEGVDGSGKTTLVKKLSEYVSGFITSHEGPPPKDSFKHYLKQVQEDNRRVLKDRFHIGECIYPIIKQGGRKPLNEAQVTMLELALLSTGSLLVFCTASDDFIKKSFKEKGEDFITFDQALNVRRMYFGLVNQSRLPFAMYMPETDNTESFINNLLSWYDTRLRASAETYDFKSIGEAPADIMIVGDRVNDRKSTGRQLAFVSHQGSGLFLCSMLNNKTTYYLTNAVKTMHLDDNLEALNDEIKIVKPRKIVGMGNAAKHHLDILKVIYEPTFHPQYWKRFKTREHDTLIDILKL
jgi:hypothetical protein